MDPEPRLISFMGPWSEDEIMDILQFASDRTGERINEFMSIGTVLEPDPETEDARNE